MAVSKLVSAVCIAATVFLAGCDPEQPVSSSAGKNLQATAPSLSRVSGPMQAAFDGCHESVI
jgi:dihydroxyacid dehydratase/phosphogluconate dehydratase